MAAIRVCTLLAASTLVALAFSSFARAPQEQRPPQEVVKCTEWMGKRGSGDGAEVRLIGSNTICADIPSLSEQAVDDFLKKMDLFRTPFDHRL